LCEKFNWNFGKECYTQKFGVVVPTPKPTPVPTPWPTPQPTHPGVKIAGLNGFWFKGRLGESCASVCSAEGLVFDAESTQHRGGQAGAHFFPQKDYGGIVEGYGTEIAPETWHNYRWGAGGGYPNADWKVADARMMCACKKR